MVVRNPYDRIISEYNDWHAGPRPPNNEIYDITKFNEYLRFRIKNWESITRDNRGGCGHYIPQYLHLEEDSNIIINVLKFENLKEEFDSLMKKYNLNLSLDMNKNKGNDKGFYVKDFDNKTINLINDIYAKDFKLFGYDIKKLN